MCVCVCINLAVPSVLNHLYPLTDYVIVHTLVGQSSRLVFLH